VGKDGAVRCAGGMRKWNSLDSRGNEKKEKGINDTQSTRSSRRGGGNEQIRLAVGLCNCAYIHTHTLSAKDSIRLILLKTQT